MSKASHAVIFDMDGLLIDSEPFWREAEIKIFAEVGLKLSEEDCARTMGKRIDEVIAFWFEQHPWEGASQEEIIERIVREVIRLVQSRGRPKPGVRQLIKFFQERNIPLGIASSSYQRIIEAVAETLGITADIPLRYSAEHEPFGKPHPGVYLTACRLMGYQPEAAVAFEDSPNGVRAALSAGMRCVFVPDAVLTPEDVASVTATLKLNSLEEFSIAHWEQLTA